MNSGSATIATTVETDANNNIVYGYKKIQRGGKGGGSSSSGNNANTTVDINNNNNNSGPDNNITGKCSESDKAAATSSTTTTMLNLIINKCSIARKTTTAAARVADQQQQDNTSSTTNSSPVKWLNNVSNFQKQRSKNGSLSPALSLLASATTTSSMLLYLSTLSLVILCLLTNTVLCDTSGGDHANNINLGNGAIPDQIAMAAEHRIGHGPGYNSPAGGLIGGGGGNDVEGWPLQSQHDMPQIKILQVQCEKSHMRVNIEFDRPFYGMIFSKGYYSDPHCVHLAPGSGHLSATFDIYLDACGMSSSANGNSIYGPAPSGTFVENTIIIQYDPLVQEVWDQARKLRCTWYDFYEKSVTFRPFQVDMLHAVTANFLGDNLQCWMQIQVGKGPWASEVSGIVKIGQTMTMVLAIKDDENKFDMLVRNCVAHDGKRAPIQLVDAYGCVTRPKIMSRFHKIKNFGASASVVSYAYFQAFKFPDSMNVHFQCVIQVCRFQCPEPKCGDDNYGLPGPGQVDPRVPHGAYSENKETIAVPPQQQGIPEAQSHTIEPVSNSIAHLQPPPQQPQHHPHHQMRGPPLPPPGHRHHPNMPLPPLPPHPHHFNSKPIPIPMPMPGKPSTVMLPPMPMPNPGYSSVKREGMIVDEQHEQQEDQLIEDDEDEGQEPSFAALGGRPRSVDFEREEQRRQRRALDDDEHQTFVVHLHHVYKREAQEMTDVQTTRVIQVVAPGDVAFSLNGGSSSNSSLEEDSVVIESSLRGEIDGICMSVSSFIGGLVMLLLLLVVSSLVAAFLFVRVRSIHRKTGAIFTTATIIDNTEYLKQAAAGGS